MPISLNKLCNSVYIIYILYILLLKLYFPIPYIMKNSHSIRWHYKNNIIWFALVALIYVNSYSVTTRLIMLTHIQETFLSGKI